MSEHIKEVSKRGEWYTVKGVSNGKQVSVDIPAPTVESKTRKDAEKLFERGLRSVAENSR